MVRRSTSTSAFGVSKREGHDASGFYRRFTAPDLSSDARVHPDKALDKLIPPAYRGNTTTDRLEAYAADLARKVRLSFPTQVVSRMIEKGDLAVDANSAPKVTTFLKNAAPLGFQMGRTPLNSFITQNQASLFQNIAPGDVPITTESVKTLHRLFQITPSNESLQAAVKLGFTSALDVAAFDSQDFLDRFGKAFPSLDEATLVYRKAQQVNSVTLNSQLAASQLNNAPALYGLSHRVLDQVEQSDRPVADEAVEVVGA